MKKSSLIPTACSLTGTAPSRLSSKIPIIITMWLSLLYSYGAFSQPKMPFIRATSKVVDVRDGDDLQKGLWNISPEVNPDIFIPERFRGRKKVTFYTDLDSISFWVERGRHYAFGIILNGRDTAFTQISAQQQPVVTCRKISQSRTATTDSIPITLGWNNTIHLTGKINGSRPLDMIFDTGANGLVLSADVLRKKVPITISGACTSYGIGGAQQDAMSENNELSIGDLRWHGLGMVVKYSGKPSAEVVVGYNVFDGKVVEINYDRKMIVLHPALPRLEQGYSKYDLTFKGGLSYIRLTLSSGAKKTAGWFNFDTGSSGALFLNQSFAAQNGLYHTMPTTGHDRLKGSGPHQIEVENHLLPQLYIGATVLTEIPINMETRSSPDGPPFCIVGNDVLKRFNAFIDYQNDCVYLKPNHLTGALYLEQKINYLVWGGALLLSVVIAIFSVFFYKKSQRSRNASALLQAHCPLSNIS